jgi:acid phosphatase (class A)
LKNVTKRELGSTDWYRYGFLPMNDARLFLGALGFVAFLAVALAREGDRSPHWLSQDQVTAIVATEPPPPALDSDAARVDLQGDIAAQNARTPALIAEAKEDNTFPPTLFTSVIRPGMTAATDPAMFHFLEELNAQIATVVSESKNHWHRLRPFREHPDVIHPLFSAYGYSYPSGHATHSYVIAAILSDMFPDQAAALMHRADQIAQSRVDAGVHYTSDIREGEVVGREIAQELLARPAFQRAMHAAQAEVAAGK